MTAEKIGAPGACVQSSSAQEHGVFDAADIGDELMRLEDGSKLFYPVENGKDRACKQNKIGGGCGGNRVVYNFRNSSTLKSYMYL
jgi:hypothetical protein